LKKAFINSLPKSGTNLLVKCLLLFGYRERGHLSAGTVLDKKVRAYIRRILWKPRGPGYLLGINSPIEVRKSPIDAILRKVKDGQFLSGHVGYRQDLLDEILNAGFISIQVIRDPRAVLASFVPYVLGDQKHFLHTIFQSLSHEERYKAALDGITANGLTLKPLREYCLALDPWLDSKEVHTIRFEDIVGDQGGGSDTQRIQVLEHLAEVLGLPGDRITEVAENLYGPGRHTFRKGKIDSWKEEIPPDMLEHISVEVAGVLKKWGYPG